MSYFSKMRSATNSIVVKSVEHKSVEHKSVEHKSVEHKSVEHKVGSPTLHSPLNRDALHYWQMKCKGRAMPARKDIVPSEIKSILPNIFLLDIATDPLDFRYRLIGTAMDACMHGIYTGRWMRSIPHQAPPSRIFNACCTVVQKKQPITSDTPYVGKMSTHRRTEDLLLPLSENGETVTMLMVTADFL